MKRTNNKNELKSYRDLVHGMMALARSKTGAWMLIRAKCYELNIEVPTYDKIVEVKGGN